VNASPNNSPPSPACRSSASPLISFQIVEPSVPLAVGLALALLVVDVAAGRVVARLFDRERLITGTASTSPAR
jgi:hypothetical protein